MAGTTLAQAEEKLAEVLTAISAVMTGQEYRIGDRSMTRANLAELQRAEAYWDAKVRRLSGGGGIKIRGATPC
jgi:hypothetical protein